MEQNSTHDDVARFEAEQDAVMDAQFLIQDLIDEQNLTRKEVARILGVSPARFSQMMRADANPTVRTLAGALHALGGSLSFSRKCTRPAGSEDIRAHGHGHWSEESSMETVRRPKFDFRALLANDSKRISVTNDNSAAPIEGQQTETFAA